MSIHWREWKGGRISESEGRALAEMVARNVRVQGAPGAAAAKVSGDTLFYAEVGPSDSVTVYEARIALVGEAARRASDPPPPQAGDAGAGRAEPIALTGAERIARERAKQLAEWSVEHDEHEHRRCELVEAAMVMADPRDYRGRVAFVVAGASGVSARYPEPWHGIEKQRAKWNRIEQLTVAGALLAAEIDRLQREQGYEEVQQGR